MKTGHHLDRRLADAREAFVSLHPDREAARAAEIAALPVVEWKGKRLRQITCTGATGRGPHVMAVPEALLWALIDWRRFRCPYHA